MACGMQAGFDDILDSTWTSDEPKRRTGAIRRAKVLDLDNEDSEEDEQPVYCAQPFNQPDIEALAEDPSLAAAQMDEIPIYPKKVGACHDCWHKSMHAKWPTLGAAKKDKILMLSEKAGLGSAEALRKHVSVHTGRCPVLTAPCLPLSKGELA